MAMNVTIKNIPEPLHQKLKMRAAANKRSVNWEVIDIIQKAVEIEPVDVEGLLRSIGETRARMKSPALTPARLAELKNEGRP